MTTSTPKRSPVAAIVGSDPEEPPELYRWCNILLIDPHESPPSMCRRLPPLSKCCCLQGSASVSVFCSNLARLGDGGASLSIEFFPTISSVVGTCLSKKIYRPIIGPCVRRKSYPQHPLNIPTSLTSCCFCCCRRGDWSQSATVWAKATCHHCPTEGRPTAVDIGRLRI